MAPRVLGVDGCRTGWIGLALDGVEVRAFVAPTIRALVKSALAGGEVAVLGVDMPIGLANATNRRADIEARQIVGARRSSVFMTPVRAALEAVDHHGADRINRDRAGTGISRQAYGLARKILEVDEWLRETRLRVVEVHPEVSFARMAGRPLPDNKRSWAGVEHRRALLAREGIRIPEDLGEAGRRANVDDVLDAAAAAWSARRVATGQALSVPNPPEILDSGAECAIWI